MAETVGSLIDKINVVQLKIYHNTELRDRASTTAEARVRFSNKLQVLDEQLQDLSRELDELMRGILLGTTKIKVYRQFKMYGQT